MSRRHGEQPLEPGQCVRYVYGGYCRKPAKRRDYGPGLLFCDDCWDIVERYLKAHRKAHMEGRTARFRPL